MLRHSTAILLASPLLIVAVIRYGDLVLPKAVRDNLKAMERDLETFTNDQRKLQQELARDRKAASNSSLTGASQRDAFTSFFIPIPIWTRQVPSPPYEFTDPEWNEFLKLNGDLIRRRKLRDIVSITSVAKAMKMVSPAARDQLGTSERMQMSTDVDVVFPLAPPPVYERPGLLVTGNGIMLSSRKLPDAGGSRYHRIFHPQMFASSFWAGVKALCQFHYASFVALSLKPYSSSSDGSDTPHVQSKDQAGSDVTPSLEAEQAMPNSRSSSAIVEHPQKDSTAGPDEEGSVVFHQTLVPPPAPQSAMEAAIRAYKIKFTEKQMAALQQMPRGGCWVRGTVYLCGTNGKWWLQVEAIYIPSKDEFLGLPRINDFWFYPDISLSTPNQTTKSEQSSGTLGNGGMD